MKQIHATTRSTTTYVRMSILLILSFVCVFITPRLPNGDDLDSFLQTHLFNAGLVYAIIIGFLLYITISRKQNLDAAVSLELNKARRIYHLALNMREQEPRLDGWFSTLNKALEDYHRQYRNIDLVRYEKGDPYFRKVTYTVYKLPQMGIPYHEQLYDALLEATASATEARESINSLKDDTIGRFSWLIMLLVTILFCFTIIFYTPDLVDAKIISSAVIFALLLTLQLIYEYDKGNILRHRYISDLYLENMKKAKAPLIS